MLTLSLSHFGGYADLRAYPLGERPNEGFYDDQSLRYGGTLEIPRISGYIFGYGDAMMPIPILSTHSHAPPTNYTFLS